MSLNAILFHFRLHKAWDLLFGIMHCSSVVGVVTLTSHYLLAFGAKFKIAAHHLVVLSWIELNRV